MSLAIVTGGIPLVSRTHLMMRNSRAKRDQAHEPGPFSFPFSSYLIANRALIRARTASTTDSGTDPFFFARRTFQSSDFT